MLSALLAWSWWQERKAKTAARHQAWRHMAVIAHALYTGSTRAYELTPDLPREPDSTRIPSSTSGGWNA